jgi:hypothetical protein
MKTRFWPNAAHALSFLVATAVIPGCGADSMNDADDSITEGTAMSGDDDATTDAMEFGELEQGLVACNNVDGTNSVMAALAVATAKELRRWQPSTDFMPIKTDAKSENTTGTSDAIALSPTGKAQCADGKCWNTQALLDLQYSPATGKIILPGNIALNPSALRTRLSAKLWEQTSCEKRPVNGGDANCPVETHKLSFTSAAKGGCDTNFYFKATQPNGAALKYPAQLKNKLLWVDVKNPYVQFQSVGDVISIDPTYGLNEDSTTTTGACTASCVKMSSANVAGACCSCNSATKKFSKSAWSTSTFICQ